MSVTIEVCIDNLESLSNAIAGGANRIELCSSLALGGLTPSYGLMKQAVRYSSVPIYAMIRPRQGDFLYSSDDIESMLQDIFIAKQLGLQGVVFGALTAQGNIDESVCRQLMQAAQGMGVTFHRAIDQCQDYATALEQIVALGCQRILTSGLAPTAEQGITTIAKMNKLAQGRISIMAGAGVNASNAKYIIDHSQIQEIHLSAKTTRPSKMGDQVQSVKMDAQQLDDYQIPIASQQQILQVKLALQNVG